MNRDTFSHIRLWCPRPFGTYSQNKPFSNGTICSGTTTAHCKADDDGLATIEPNGVSEDQDEDVGTENTPPDSSSTLLAPPLPAPPSSQMEDGRVLLDTWYVIKPGNTKEKIAFFVAHQCNGSGIPRPSAMKVKGNWATDCTKAKRRRRCSSYDPPAKSQNVAVDISNPESDVAEDSVGVSETDLLSVAEMVALVEQRAALALQGMVAHGQNSPYTVHQKPVVILPEPHSSAPVSQSDYDQQQLQQESRRVAQAVAHFESRQQSLDSTTLQPELNGSARDCGDSVGGAPSHGRGEVRIAFRVSSLDPRAQSEPVGRPKCMFMSCGVGGSQAAPRGKEKITCDLYQLVSPSSRDPGALLSGSPNADPHGESITDRPPSTMSDPNQEPGPGEKAAVARERVTGFHVEVVVTGAVDQCVFYGKDSTENVQEETVCFAMTNGVNSMDASEDPPPGQLFFLQSPATEDESCSGVNNGMRSLDCANNNGPVGTMVERPDSPLTTVDDCSDPPLCRLYRHVSHDFLEIRFQIQRLLEPRQYMLSLPDHIMVNIFSYLPTRSLAALKCTCHDFKNLIETYGVHATDSRWNQDPLYRDDPCKQCKRQYERGDVSLCRWHPKPYHHDLPYGRSYWMCCRRTDKDTPGCRVGLHDNNWVQPCEMVQSRLKRDDVR